MHYDDAVTRSLDRLERKLEHVHQLIHATADAVSDIATAIGKLTTDQAALAALAKSTAKLNAHVEKAKAALAADQSKP